MSSNHTEHYSLSQWEAEDKVLRTDFNEDNEKIDEVLGAHAVRLDKLGNCGIEHFAYVGNDGYGTASPTVIRFSRQPVMLLVIGDDGSVAFANRFSASYLCVHTGKVIPGSASWSGGRISLVQIGNSLNQMNLKGRSYHAFGFFSEDGK